MVMKKIINDPNKLADELLEGYTLANKNIIKLVEGTHLVVRRAPKEKGKVKLVMGNGCGHEPAVTGWVGEGMLDANIVGDIFTAPSGEEMFRSLQLLDDGSPILLLVQNHAGDVMNANVCMDLALDAGMNIKQVLYYDDIATAPKGMEEERRGIGGMLFYSKIVGALAERGGTLDECVALFEKVRDNTRTLAVAIKGSTHPVTGLAQFELADDEIQIGMGVHGEGGLESLKLCTSKELAANMGNRLIDDKPYQKGDEIVVFVNGSGSTTVMELSIFYRDLYRLLDQKGITALEGVVGNYLTTQEAAGFSLSLCKMEGQMFELWNDHCRTGCFSK